jgi:hypothetical protein
VIISPVAGTITWFVYTYKQTLNYSISFHLPPTDYLHDKQILMQDNKEKNFDSKFIAATIIIRTKDNKQLSISGIYPTKYFRTGETIKAGEVIGKVGYCYSKINKPAIVVSLSEKNRAIDPLTPFGLKSTFKKLEPKKVNSVTKNEALSDIELFASALQEGYPSLYNYNTPQEWERFINQIKNRLTAQNDISDFKTHIADIIAQLRDNHFGIISHESMEIPDRYTMPSIYWGFLNDSLIISRTSLSNTIYYGKRVDAINGFSADSLKTMLLPLSYKGSDGYIKSYSNSFMLNYGWNMYNDLFKNMNFDIKFHDKTSHFFPEKEFGTGNKKSCTPLPQDRSKYLLGVTIMECKKIDQQTAYLKIPHFDLTEVEIDSIARFIKEISDLSYQNLIIDVRNNPGGDETKTNQLFALIAQKPYAMNLYNQVNKKGTFDFFKYCSNYTDETTIFEEYEAQPGKNGFYYIDNDIYNPNPKYNFKGKVYVLTNEFSVSASTIFAALVHKYQRGVIVGRETANTYHQMTANKFAHLILPNSQIEVAIPLVKCVFDTLITSDIPFGRGVMPDYPVNLTLHELDFLSDSILNYACQLIKNGQYIKEEATLSNEKSNTKIGQKILYGMGALAGIGLLILFIVNFKKHQERRKME